MSESSKRPADSEEEFVAADEVEADKAPKGEVAEGVSRVKDEHKDK